MTNGRWKVKMIELLTVIIAAILLISISSAETGASDYYNKLGMELNEERRFDEANESFNTAIWLIEHDLADAPVLTDEIDLSSQKFTANNAPFYVQEMGEGATLRFGVTNNNTKNMIIESIYIDVLDYSSERLSDVTQDYHALIPDPEYSCTIHPQPGSYECQVVAGSNYSLELLPEKIERLSITLRAKEEGVYVVRIGFEYIIGHKSKRYNDSKNLTIEFYDSKKINMDGWGT